MAKLYGIDVLNAMQSHGNAVEKFAAQDFNNPLSVAPMNNVRNDYKAGGPSAFTPN